MAAPMENDSAFANRRDEVVHRVQEHMKGFIQQSEALHKELANLDKQRDEVVATIEVLQAAVNGLQRSLSEASEKDLPVGVERDYNARAINATTAARTTVNWKPL